MSDTYKYTLEIIIEHIYVCEKRFSEIPKPSDFINDAHGGIILDSIVTRLQSIGENLKRLLKSNTDLESNYPEVEWKKIILFRDFISHHYEKLDHEIIFDICEDSLPKLKKAIQKELATLS